MSRRRSTPQQVVGFALGQQGKTRADLVPLLGSKSRVSEFIAGKRRLSLAQILAVRKALTIPADLLIETGLELDDPLDPSVPIKPAGLAGERGTRPDESPGREPQHSDIETLLAAQRDFIARLNKLVDDASRSMGKRW